MKLAESLLRSSLAILPELDEPSREEALLAIDSFVAQPVAAPYLAAMRVLQQLRRQAQRARTVSTLAERSRQRGLETLAAVPSVGAELAAALQALPVDARTGQRLQALAALLDAHRELASRVRRAEAERRPVIEKMRDRAATLEKSSGRR
jgi:hypothetical protein